jgi:hypothetical protein
MTTLEFLGKSVDVGNGVTVLRLAVADRERAIQAMASRAVVVGMHDFPAPPASAAPASAASSAATGAVGQSPTPHVVVEDGSAEAEAEIAKAEAAVADARAAVDHADRAYRDAQSALLEANRSLDPDAAAAVAEAEARLEVAQAGAAAARRTLVQAREAADRTKTEDDRRRAEAMETVRRFQEERTLIEAQRAEVVARLASSTDPRDARAVEEALAGLRRLQQVKPKPSPRAVELAERWTDVRSRLRELPTPPAPPEWLAAPALVALKEAREALAGAEAGARPVVAEPATIEAVEAAHGEVLESEQRVMRKASRGNKRRLETAQEAERAALGALGVASYGEYLQKVGPRTEGRTPGEDPVAIARAALADAEAVWEELHGGEVTPEYTAAKEFEATVRLEAIVLLGREVVDIELDIELRGHLEAVVDTGWAEETLADALRRVGIERQDDLIGPAEAFLATVPMQRAEREAIEAELAEVDARLASVESELTEHQSNAFFGEDTAGGATAESAGGDAADPFAELQLALDEAEAAELAATSAVSEARERLEASERATTRVAEFERDSDATRTAVDTARERLAEVERALEAARRASAEAAVSARAAEVKAAAASAKAAQDAAAAAAAASAAAAAEAAAATAKPRLSVEANLWLLARLTASDADRPVVVDARAIPGTGTLRLLEKAAAARPVVLLGDEGEVSAWAKGLGSRATVRTV